jgi:cytochrome c2
VKRLLVLLSLTVATLVACQADDVDSAVESNAGPEQPAATAAPPAHPAVAHEPIQPLGAQPLGHAERGRELVEKFECVRCHEGVAEVKAIPSVSHCTQCHVDVMDGKFKHKPDNDRWRKNVAHLVAMPSLASMGERLNYDWVVGFLIEPHDLRPGLESTMPRLNITSEQARDIATFLMKGETNRHADEPADGDLEAGRKLLEKNGCGSCHRFTGVATLPDAPQSKGRETRVAVMLAPDLRWARKRLDRTTLVKWLLDPQSVKKGTPMPQTPMSEAEARDIAAYILHAELEPLPEVSIPEPLPLLDRRVRFAEVAERVLDVTCRHCHGNPDVALGDGGPGNTGGFGFEGRRLDLTSYARVNSGYLDDEGERQSAFVKMKDGTPRLIASLYARHAEVAGKPNPEVRGMPLGLPPVPMKDIQLLATWIAQGRPR